MFLEHYGLIEEPLGVTPKLSLVSPNAGLLGVVSGATRKTALPHTLFLPLALWA